MAQSKAGIFLALGLGLFGLLSSGDANAGDREAIGPIPVPESDADLLLIDQTICDCWAGLGNVGDMAQLRMCLVQTMHPDVPFPPVEGDDPTVFAVWALFTQRINSFLSSPDKSAWCNPQGIPGQTIPGQTIPGQTVPLPTIPGQTIPGPAAALDLLADMTTESPQPGYMYFVGSDPELGNTNDSLSRIVRKALNSVIEGAGDNSANRVSYMHCITSGPGWNWPLYTSSSFSSQFPSYAGVNGMGLRRAFYPWNENVKQAVAELRMPKRGFTQAGSKIQGVGSSYAALWLPPVDPTALAQDVVTCGLIEWSDGSSSINPPPEFLELLAGS
jgi:hypothetical protein